MQSWLFLALVLVVAAIGKNMSLVIASIVVMLLKFIPYTRQWFPVIQAKGINWGVTIISIAILIPIATGQITFKDLWQAFKMPAGWIAVACVRCQPIGRCAPGDGGPRLWNDSGCGLPERDRGWPGDCVGDDLRDYFVVGIEFPLRYKKTFRD